ncbi:Transcriptional activator spt7, partial [Coemansia sp. RSA 2703]
MWTGDASLTSNVVTPSSLDGTPGVAATGKSGTGETLKAAEVSVVCAMAAFHARSAIFEQYVAVLCDSGECTQCTSAVSAHNDIDCIESQLAGETTDGPDGSCAERADEDGDAAAVEVPSVYETKPQAPLVSRSLDEDDDYDDDDDEDGDNNVGGSENKTESKDDAQKAEKDSSSSGSNSAEKTVAGVAVEFKASTQPSVAATNADAVAETSTNQPADTSAEDSGVSYRFALGGVFHTLDELAEAVHGQEVHEIHVQQIKDVALQRAAEPKDMLVNKIGALQNMKNLAQFIDNHRDSVNLSTRELSHLLSEVRPKRTKWANDRRIGQAELYDALEHTLHELKAMGEAAAPFLNQVKRKDAPDYYKVIKHPMDLGAMAKNLRNEAYDSKRQFADHLQLIRDNCYTYNTEPGNYYRRS